MLIITAEELLRELVEEHKDAAFEYKSSTGLVRLGRWVGGDRPIQDAKTRSCFKMLALWCQQVSSIFLKDMPSVPSRFTCTTGWFTC